MRQHMPDVYLLAIVMDCRNQSKFIPADVEDREFPDLIDRAEDLFELGERAEVGIGHNGVPHPERLFRLPVRFRELAYSLSCYDMHNKSIYLNMRYCKPQSVVS